MLGHEGAEHRVAAERGDPGGVIALDAEQQPDPVHHMDQALPVGQVSAQQQAVLPACLPAWGDLKQAGRARHGDGPPVGVAFDRLDPRHQARGEEGPGRVPVVTGHDR